MKQDKDIRITPEEKELLRQLMENDDLCRRWDFFEGAGLERPVPPPEYFMRGKPKRPSILTRLRRFLKGRSCNRRQ